MSSCLINFEIGSDPIVDAALVAGADAFATSILNAYPTITVPANNQVVLREAIKLSMSGLDIFVIKYNNTISILQNNPECTQYSSTGALTIVSDVPGKESVQIGKEDVTRISNLTTVDWQVFLTFMTTPVL